MEYSMTTSQRALIKFQLNEFDESKVIEWQMHVTDAPFSLSDETC